jgi:hypothetical protein
MVVKWGCHDPHYKMPKRESLQVPQRKSNVLFEECWKPITRPLAVGIGDVTKSKTAVELVN